MTPFLRRLLLALFAGGWGLPALAACEADIREFALLASMGMQAESIEQYRQLQRACGARLRQISGEALPAPTDSQKVLELGRRLYAADRDGKSRQAGSALASAKVPDVNTDALKGVGPDDTARALGGMALDVLAAGLGSRQRHDQARTVRQAADGVRGNEPRWGNGAAGREVSGVTGGGGTAAAQPGIPLPANLASQLSCNGTMAPLAPAMRPYRTDYLRMIRQDILGQSIPAAISAAKSQGFNKASAIQALRQQAAAFDQGAAEAAETANQTDGRGSVSIPQAASDQFPLDFPCDNDAAIHASAVCAFIEYRWKSLLVRADIEAFEQCWK